MKKIIPLVLVLLVIPVVLAVTSNAEKNVRVMADTASVLDKLVFRLKGCSIVHELNDATALRCPKGVQIEGAFEDKVYHIMDMDTNIQINADGVWNLGHTGTGVTVAVLDTGIDTDHPELVSITVGGKGFGYNTYEDDNGHGTHVAGIITSDGTTDTFSKGVAPDAEVWTGKVCNSGGSCHISDIAAGIEYVVNNNIAETISISIGGGGTGGPNCNRDYLAQKVNWAVDNGVTVVVAAGNTAGVVSSPACASGAIAVGAVDKSNVRAYFSGTGKALDIMAPGVSIYSSVMGGGYEYWQGTSMATPHVSATVALMKQKNPTWTDADIKEALYNTAEDLGLSSRKQGHGRVDAYGAVTYTGEAPPSKCKKKGPKCNCNGICDLRETIETCPWDCP